MKIVQRMAPLAGLVDGRHFRFAGVVQFLKLKRPWLGTERSLQPSSRSGLACGMTPGTIPVTSNTYVLHLFDKTRAGMMGRNFAR